jgi:hypothetical protein
MSVSQALMAGAQLAGNSSTFAFGGTEPEPYLTVSTNWYKSKPYGFVFFNRSATAANYLANSFTIYLPILPSNIQVVTHFATNIVTTLYGVIEEHSEVRYYDIRIVGTTGIAPRFIQERKQGASPAKVQSTGRSAFENGSLVGNLGGFLPEVTNVINQVADTVTEIGNTLGGGPKNPTGIDPDKSGYVAFHNLYKFFLKYKKDAAGIGASGTTKRKVHPIQFLNYKDGIKYDCVPVSFTLTRSADNPMLYHYDIKLRAYNLRDVDANPPEIDQLEKLGLGGLQGQSIFSSLTSAAGSAAALVSGLL